ncbi:ABC transporter glutamine-binding protein GlnH precursor [Candidatus Arsenophonus lipoptenae]|uniref:ABC transporter glutamine-binding protein GlnH n=1 Tax=Candidatus Arsenophonus lipoptenae TaxID=634113 RepID=A0A0X9W318_9GAMM|nr:transporter substrate-binding domain-containing protein [Candidatus Arsenophonus lipoptenae]AMA64909.1 ABC transporter glutamine-binding protein GlnH precursor [Candidatus Arsenophonus lipoptenae]
MIFNFLIIILYTALNLISEISYADKLNDIKKTKTIRIAVFDSNPPFGFIDPNTKKLAGYDIDIAKKIANNLNVKLILRPTNPANRIPLLISGKVDLIGANFTITSERAKQIHFSIPIFSTEQKFIARKGLLKTINDITMLRIGADKGTVQEITLRKYYPNIKIISYDDTPFAFAALQNGNVQAITQDDAKLIGLLSNLPENIKRNYEISPFSITHEYQALAAVKGETNLINAINNILLNLENNGQAKIIYDRWFGPKTKAELPRGSFQFTISKK